MHSARPTAYLTSTPLLAAALLGAALAPTSGAQCLLDRVLPSQPTLAPQVFAFQGPDVALSGDWLAFGNKSADGTLYTVDFFERGGDGLWAWSQALDVPSGEFTGHQIALDGEFGLIATGSEVQSYRLDSVSHQWQVHGTPYSTFWSIGELDYDHPYAIVANPSYDLSGIFLNGQGRILEMQPNGDWISIGGFSGTIFDQYAGDGVAVAGDRVAYGAPGYDIFGKAAPGFVRYYRIDPFAFGGLEFLGELSDPSPTPQSDFGAELAMSADYLAVRSANGSSSGSPVNGERIVMFRQEFGSFVPDGAIQLPQGWTSIGDTMVFGANSLAVTLRGNQGTRVALYQRLQGSWVLRTSFDEPEQVDPSLFALAADGQRVVTASADVPGPNGVHAAAWAWDFSGLECPGLVTSPRELSVSQGGEVDWVTSLAPLFGGDLFLVLGSSSGTSPGVPLGTLQVPLNFDEWSLFTLTSINQGPLAGTLGTLDNLGGAVSRLTAPAGNDPALVGATLHQATLTFDPLTGAATGVSGASALQLVP
jgi:hypothetical protein